jgi:divalent metal cation (Fe/Co/Zn/Cd) transporter
MDTTAVNHLFSKLAEGIASAADALSVPAAEVWRIYVRQSFVIGITEIAMAIGFAVLMVVGVRFCRYCKVQYDEKTSASNGYSSAGDGWLAGGVIGGVITGLLIIPLMLSLAAGIPQLLNPEFYAIERLLAHL